MNLYTNGCSWTWGGSYDELFKINGVHSVEERLKYTWPGHLKKILNANKVTDLSDGCGSNQRILRTTYDWLLKQPTKELAETVAVIQFTDFSRFELYDPSIYNDKNNHNSAYWIKCKNDCIEPEQGYNWNMNLTEYEKKIQEVQRHLATTNEVEDVYRNIGYIYALKGLFESYNLKNFYIWHLNSHWEIFLEKTFCDDIYENINVLDDIATDARGNRWVYDRISKNDNHPSLEGHKQLAQIIYENMIRKGYKENNQPIPVL